MEKRVRKKKKKKKGEEALLSVRGQEKDPPRPSKKLREGREGRKRRGKKMGRRRKGKPAGFVEMRKSACYFYPFALEKEGKTQEKILKKRGKKKRKRGLGGL